MNMQALQGAGKEVIATGQQGLLAGPLPCRIARCHQVTQHLVWARFLVPQFRGQPLEADGPVVVDALPQPVEAWMATEEVEQEGPAISPGQRPSLFPGGRDRHLTKASCESVVEE